MPLRKRKKVKTAALNDPVSIRLGTDVIKKGGVVVVQVGGVIGMFADGRNLKGIKKIFSAKNITDTSKPLSSMMLYKHILPHVEINMIHPELVRFLSDHELTDRLTGALIHLRLPVKNDAPVPDSMKSHDGSGWIIHNLSPAGHPVRKFIETLNGSGIDFVAVSTLNKHNEPEITSFRQAVNFCNSFSGTTHAVSLALFDDLYKPKNIKGSLTIIDTKNKNIIREGFLPVYIAELIFDTVFGSDQAKKAKFIHWKGFDNLKEYILKEAIAPEQVRELISGLMTGKVKLIRGKLINLQV